jgi:hypothetical protein
VINVGYYKFPSLMACSSGEFWFFDPGAPIIKISLERNLTLPHLIRAGAMGKAAIRLTTQLRSSAAA